MQVLSAAVVPPPDLRAAESVRGKRIALVGGTGRVGRSTAAALLRLGVSGEALTLCGRSREAFERAAPGGAGLRFAQVELDDRDSLAAALAGQDLVVHTAGPFQGRGRCDVLEAALEAGVPAYLDVCDDDAYARRARSLSSEARAKGLHAVTCGGIFPGVSNLLASSTVRGEAGPEGRGAPVSVSFSYFTAGTGGAGATILATSLLLCGEEALVYRDGVPTRFPPVSGRKVVDFGKGGRRETFLYNLPETESCHSVLGVPNVSARFGTSPGIWNGAMAALAALLPRSVLADPRNALAAAKLLEPLVRAVDAAVGEATAIRVDVSFGGNGGTLSSRFVHDSLSESVGNCVAAFALDALEKERGAEGVFWPEEEGALGDVQKLLARAAQGTREYALAKVSERRCGVARSVWTHAASLPSGGVAAGEQEHAAGLWYVPLVV